MTRRPLAAGAVLLAVAVLGFLAGHAWSRRDRLAPVETVLIAEAGLRFQARLDTGAVVSSVNALDIEVVGGGAQPSRRDAGKQIRFVLVNEHGERRPVSARIAEVRGIRTADCRELRYHVHLTVVFRGRAHRVLTNLNDRSAAADKLLLGRNWLRHGYTVAPDGSPLP